MSSRKSKADEFDEDSVVPRQEPGDGEPPAPRWGRPVYKGEMTPCFADGLLFRVVEPGNNNRWSFYNDTVNCEMRVDFVFGKDSALKALENTEMEELEDGSYRAVVMVYPLETELFIEGDTDGYTSNIRAQPLSEDYLKDMARQDYELIKKETAALYSVCGDAASTDQMVQACLDNRMMFVDFSFPPEQMTLQIGFPVQLKVLPWERPCMFLSDDNYRQCRLFRNGVHPCNIDEGDLGDSWLTGAMACLAEFPDKIRDLFRHPTSAETGKAERQLGIYRVTLNRNGWWTSVIVDDYLPVAGGRPKFGRSKDDYGELWVSILQKAYAKVFGGYGYIVAGDPLHALQDLCGCPCTPFDNAFVESTVNETYELFNNLASYNRNGFQILFTTPTKETIMSARGSSAHANVAEAEAAYVKARLLLGHIYAVLKVGYFEEKGLRILQFRNPWVSGNSDWKGRWNKQDKNWSKHPEVARFFDFSREDDGTFFMEWTDVQDYFLGCGVCFLQHPMHDYRIRGTFFQNVPTTCLEISVRKPVLMNLILSQEDTRGTDKQEYAPIMVSVAHGGGQLSPMQVVSNSGFDHDHPKPDYAFLQSRDVSMFYEFVPQNSPYLVVPRSMSQTPKLPYILGILSSPPIGEADSDIRVAFRALAPENRIFDNFQRFNCETVATETEFQAQSPSQYFPDKYVGTAIRISDE